MLYFLFLISFICVAATKPKPNIFFVLVDDLGFGNVDFTSHLFPSKQTSRVFKPSLEHELHLKSRQREVSKSSSFISALAKEGRVLLRHYAHSTCSPSRSSLQSGRLPVHVQMSLQNPCHLDSGIPPEMTCVGERLQVANYSSHFVGKWDAGMAYPKQLPVGRGYDTSLNFFSHGNWMWSEETWIGSLSNASRPPDCRLDRGCTKDLWDTDRPATKLNGTLYEEYLFRNRLLEIIYDASDRPEVPLFLMYAPRVAHYPLQAPRHVQNRFAFIPHRHRRVYTAMIAVLNDVLKSVVAALKDTNRWENTLMVFTSDNGGVVKSAERCVDNPKRGVECFNGEAGASNYPLRGGKYTNWEGGIRVATFVSGGFIPHSVRGTPIRDMMHMADWFATLSAAAGLTEPFVDVNAKNLPEIDSINCLDMLLHTKVKHPPRESILLSSKALIKGKYKLLGGVQLGANWGGPLYPNISTFDRPVYDSTMVCQPACVFDVEDDPLETVDLAPTQPQLVRDMQVELERQAATIWNRPGITSPDPQCLIAARDKWGGFLGPFKEVDGLSLSLDQATVAFS